MYSLRLSTWLIVIMIHLLTINPELTVKEVQKLSRRYAMTGGYELALEENLTAADLKCLFERYLPVLQEYDPQSSRYFSSNAYRILSLVHRHSELPEEIRNMLESLVKV